MAQTLDLRIRIAADGRAAAGEIERVERQLRGVRPSAEQASQAMARMKTVIMGLGAAAAAVGIAKLTQGLGDIAREAEQAQRNMLRTEAILKATGHAAGLTAEQLKDNASSLALATLQSVEGVEQAQQILLTFKSVAGDTFIEATEAAANLATVTGGNLNSAMTQLGKALEDPITGLTALRRSGVSFTESQKEMIKELVNTNQLAEAQSVILGELATQYGGVARREAEGYAGAVDTLGQRIQELKLEIADSTDLLDTMTGVTNATTRAVEALTASVSDGAIGDEIERWGRAADGVSALANAISGVASAVVGFANDIINANPHIQQFINLVSMAGRLANPFGTITAGLGAVGAAAGKADVELEAITVTADGLAGGFNPVDLAFNDIFTSIKLTGGAAAAATPKLKATGGAARSAGGSAKKAAKEVDHLTEALTKQASGIDSLIGEYLPLRAAEDDYTDGVRKAAAAHALGKLSAEEYQTVIAGLKTTYDEAVTGTKTTTETFATLWTGALEEIGSDIQSHLADSFEELFNGSLKSAKDFFSDLFDIFKRSLAQLAASVLQNKIVIPIMATMTGGSIAGAAAAGTPEAAASGATGGTMGLGSIGQMFGGNSIGLGLGQSFAGIATNLGMMNATTASMAGNLAATSNLALGVGGAVGGIASNMLFNFDSEAESIGNTIGSTAGAVIGAAVLTPILGPFAPLVGSFLGGSAGGFLGGLFGGEDKPKYQANMWTTGGVTELGDTNDLSAEAVQQLNETLATINSSTQQYAQMLGEGAQTALGNLSVAFSPVAAADLETHMAYRWARGIEAALGGAADEAAPGLAEVYREQQQQVADIINSNSRPLVDESQADAIARLMNTAVIEAVIYGLEDSGQVVGESLRGLYAEIADAIEDPTALPAALQALNMMLGQVADTANIINPESISTLEQSAEMLGRLRDQSDQASTSFLQLGEYMASLEEPAETAARLLPQVQSAFELIGADVPASEAAFKDFVQSLDLTSDAGLEAAVTLGGVTPLLQAYYQALEAAGTTAIGIMDSVTAALVDNTADLQSGIRDILEQAVYEGIDAGPAFAAMIEEYIVGTLLDSISSTIYAAVVDPLIASAVSSATSLATGGSIAGTAMETGGTEAAVELASIVDDAIATTQAMAALLEDPEFIAEMERVGVAIAEIAAGVVTAFPSTQNDLNASLAADAAAAADAAVQEAERIAEERNGLLRQEMQLLGDTAGLRQMELDKLDASNHELQTRIWLLEDEQALQAAFPATNDAIAEMTALMESLGLEMVESSQELSDLVHSQTLTADQTTALAANLDTLTDAMAEFDAQVTSTAEIIASYESAFGRSPTAGGIDYWASQSLNQEELNDQLLRSASESDLEYAIDQVYMDLFGRYATSDGLDYWAEQWVSGMYETWDDFMLAIMSAASPDDLDRMTDPYFEQRRQQEIDLLKAQGDAQAALNMERQIALEQTPAELQGTQEAIWLAEDAAKTRSLEIQLMEAQGLSHEALMATRKEEIQALSRQDAALQAAIWAAEDAANTRSLEIQLLEAQGRSHDALIASREKELDALSATDAALQEAIWAAEEAVQMRSMEIELIEAQGYSHRALIATRRQEVKAMSDSEAALQMYIWAAQDAAQTRTLEIALVEALGDSEAALAMTREDELRALSKTDAALQEQIWAAEDAALAQEEANAALSELADELQRFADAAADISKSIGASIADIRGDEANLPQLRSSALGQISGVMGGEFDAGAAQSALDAADEYQSAIIAQHQDRLSALQEERNELESASNALDSVRDSLKDWVDALDRTSDALSMAQKKAASWAQYQTTLAMARAGDVDALGSITGIADDYLSSTKATSRTALEYQAEVAKRRNEIAGLAIDTKDPNLAALESIDAQIEDLTDETIAQLVELKASVDGLQAYWAGEAQRLTDQITGQIDESGGDTVDEIEWAGVLINRGLNPLQSLASDIVANMGNIDLNVDGMVSYEEFANFFGHLATATQMETWFNMLDVNGDGLLSSSELTRQSVDTQLGKLIELVAGSSAIQSKLYEVYTTMQLYKDMFGTMESGIGYLGAVVSSSDLASRYARDAISYLSDILDSSGGIITAIMNSKAFESSPLSAQEEKDKLLSQSSPSTTANAANTVTRYTTIAPTITASPTVNTSSSSRTISSSLKSIGSLLSRRGFSEGGIAAGPMSGYAELLHGTEAIVPLSGGRSIPVEMSMPTPQPNQSFDGMIQELQAVRSELADVKRELAESRQSAEMIGANQIGQLKEHNRRERKRDVVPQKVESV